MHREQSLSKLSSRSLSKIKTKIDLAFSRPVNNENRSKNGQNLMPSRSKSTKSLGKSKCEPSDNTIPFAIAIKSGLVQTDRKSSALQTPIKRPVNSLKGSETRKEQVLSIKNQVFCEKMLLNEYIKGFSWYHSAGKELISVCKKSQDNTTLRYFAVKQFQDGKNNKKVVAALEEDTLYVGSKDYIILKSDNTGLISKEEASKAVIKGCHFALVCNSEAMNFCNIKRVVVDVFRLISDGVNDLDAVANITGRKIRDSFKKTGDQKTSQIVVLIVMVEKRRQKYQDWPEARQTALVFT